MGEASWRGIRTQAHSRNGAHLVVSTLRNCILQRGELIGLARRGNDCEAQSAVSRGGGGRALRAGWAGRRELRVRHRKQQRLCSTRGCNSLGCCARRSRSRRRRRTAGGSARAGAAGRECAPLSESAAPCPGFAAPPCAAARAGQQEPRAVHAQEAQRRESVFAHLVGRDGGPGRRALLRAAGDGIGQALEGLVQERRLGEARRLLLSFSPRGRFGQRSRVLGC